MGEGRGARGEGQKRADAALLLPRTSDLDGKNVRLFLARNAIFRGVILMKTNMRHVLPWFTCCLGLLTARAADTQAPTVQAVSPAPGTTQSNLTSITVTFSEAVAGVVASDFLVNGSGALAVSESNTVFTFTFSQPPAGPVQVRWDLNHTVYDLAGNRFDETAAGASWDYTLVDGTPPQVTTIAPVPGARVASLAQIEVGFNEAVTGVDAADLRVNAQPATNVLVTAAGTYLFQFAPAPTGSVTVAWAAGHGIRDTAPVPNAFGGGSWGYQINPALATGDVVINEFSAENLNGLLDEDGQQNDWIELRNRGTTAVSLLGWSLTDDPTQPGKWMFPSVTLDPGALLVIFASGKDRRPAPPGRLHTNFRLNAFGNYLGLYNAQLPKQVVDEFAPEYPPQRADISYGRTPSGAVVYFSPSTPGAANPEAPTFSGVAAMPSASVKSGLFNQPFSLVLSTETPGASIYYSLDGSPPVQTNTLYTGPITIAGRSNRAAVLVRAAAYRTDFLPSDVMTRTYLFPDYVVYQPTNPPGFPPIWDSPCSAGNNCVDIPGDYEMDPQLVTNGTNMAIIRAGLMKLPTLSIVSSVDLLFGPAKGVYVRREDWNQQPVNVEWILPDGGEGFNVPAGLEIQGGTSPYDQGSTWKSKKLSMRLLFKGDFGAKNLDYPLFADSPVAKFNTLVLDNGLNHVWHYNGGSSTEQQRQTAQYVRDTFMSDLQLAAGGQSAHWRFAHVYLNGLYWGITGLHERPDDKWAEEYFGGDASEYDVLRHNSGNIVAGSNTVYNQMFTLARSGLANNATYETLQQQYLDLPWFVDYMIINFWGGNEDWAHQNWYAVRHRVPGAGWRYISWDAEHVVENAARNSVTLNNAGGPTELYQLLKANREFRTLFGDRVHQHFFNRGILAVVTNTPVNLDHPQGNQPAEIYLRRIKQVEGVMVGESARWGDSGTTTTDRSNNPLTRDGDWRPELFGLMGWTNAGGNHASTFNYFPNRSATVLGQLKTDGVYPNVNAPVFSQHGGRVAPAYPLYLTNLNGSGTVYYTTNDADPRVYGSGAVSPQAVAWTGTPVVLGQSLTVKARTLAGTNWSALNEATFQVGALGVPLRLTEIMYNPPLGPALEFLELMNTGTTDLDLSGYTFEGITFTFVPGTHLAPGARLVLASSVSTNTFAVNYPGVVVSGYFGGALDNGGERIAIKDSAGRTITSVTYDDQNGWPTAADGAGYSLEIIDAGSDPNDPANWRASAALKGTPGQAPAPPSPATIVLNEIMADNLAAVDHAGTHPDWLELYNAGSTTVDLTGWSLSDDGNPRKFVFTNGPSLAPGDYQLVWCDSQTNTTPGWHTGFSLDRAGASLFLYDANTNRVDAVSFGAQLTDLTVGRVDGSWQLTVPTSGATNVAAGMGAQTNLALNEWLANAPPGGADWIELYSRSATTPVALGGIYLGTSNALFQIRALSFLAPGGFLQLLADELPGPEHLDFKLPAASGAIYLFDTTGAEISRVVYGPQTESVSQGRLPNGATNQVSFAGTASPGASNYLASYSGAILNEVLAINHGAVTNAAGRAPDFVELVNTNGTAFDLGGMRLSTDLDVPDQWVFPPGSSIPGNGHLVVWFDGDRPPSISFEAVLNAGRPLAGQSGAVHLFNRAGQVVDSVAYGFQVEDVSIGRSGGAWRLLSRPTPGTVNAPAASLGPVTGLRFNEWMADPAAGDDWFELHNPAAQPVELSRLNLTDDPSIAGLTQFQVAPLSFIGPGGFVKWVADGNLSGGRDHVSFSLDASGETLRLYTVDLVLIDSVDFGLQQAGVSQGRLPDGTATIVGFAETPTPGESNYLPLPNALVNEVLTHTDPPLEDAIELFNPTPGPVNLGGWFLSDSAKDFKKYRIPNGTVLPPGGFLVFYEADFNSANPATPFALSSAHGGEVWLSSADALGNLTGTRARARFGAAENGVSFGRYLTSVGAEFTALSAPTFGVNNPGSVADFRTGTGAPNAYPKVGPLVISEIMYHPPDTGTNDNTLDEFIEICNVTPDTVPLSDPAHPENTWRLEEGITFVFPSGASLPSGACLLLVHFDPAADPAQLTTFRDHYGISPLVPIYGPYGGKLANDGEELELAKPDAPETAPPDVGFVPYIGVDRVVYSDTAPWPPSADGSTNGVGLSLHRRVPLAYGNDPVNWLAGPPSPGSTNYAEISAPPTILQQPASQAATVGGSVSFTVVASGGELRYQWRWHGTNLAGAASATLVLSNLHPSQAGPYSVVVSNSLGVAVSAEAYLVLARPVIMTHPVSQTNYAGTTVSLTCVAAGDSPLNYQWRKNGTNLTGATSPTLTLANAQSGDSGPYSALAYNLAGAATSAVAHLVVIVPVQIAQQPQSQRGPPGTNATFTVLATGTGTLRYQWWFNGATPLAGATNASLTVSNAQLANNGDYAVQIADELSTVMSSNATLTILVRPVITVQPTNTLTVPGGDATFFVEAYGTTPMGFRWRRGGATFTGGIIVNTPTNSSLTVTNVPQHWDGTNFDAVVTNLAAGSATSTRAILMVFWPPIITAPPTNQTVNPGTNVTFAVVASGGAPLRYQWWFAEAPLAGRTNATLSLTNVQAGDEGYYSVVVTNRDGAATSPTALLTVLRSPRLFEPEMLAGGGFRTLIEGNLNRSYALETSDNLTNWTQLGTVLCTNRGTPFIDPTATQSGQRFYRARLVP